MKKMVLALTLALALGVCGAAVAEQGVAYGVYSLGNEQPDSLIRVTLDCDGETVTGAVLRDGYTVQTDAENPATRVWLWEKQ